MKLENKRFEKVKSVRFFLYTMFLSPSHNPACYLFLSAGVFLTIAGDVKPPDVLFMMFVSCLSAASAGKLLKSNNLEMSPFMYILPLPLSSIVKRIFAASVIYGILIQSIFLLFLAKSLQLPQLGNAHVLFYKNGTGEIISILAGFMTDISGRAEIPVQIMLRPSLVFGVVKTVSGWNVSLFQWVLFGTLFVSGTVYFTMRNMITACCKLNGLFNSIHGILIVGFFLLGCFLFIDMVFPSGNIWKWYTQYCENRLNVFQSFLCVSECLLVISIIKFTAVIRKI